MNLHDEVRKNSEQMEKSREELDRLAEAALRRGVSLGDDENVLRMSREMDVLVLRDLELKRLIAEQEATSE